jgi:hypothetical protein
VTTSECGVARLVPFRSMALRFLRKCPARQAFSGVRMACGHKCTDNREGVAHGRIDPVWNP